MTKSPSEYPNRSALDAALHLLGLRPWGEKELRERLRKRGFQPEVVDSCIERLFELRLLDDRTFAAALTRHRIKLGPRGRFSLTRELTRKGIDRGLAEDTVAEVMEAEGVREEDLAREVARRWLERQAPDTIRCLAGGFSDERERARRRLFGHLSRRGFQGDAIRAALDEASSRAAQLAAKK